jgi:hypothetical protein
VDTDLLRLKSSAADSAPVSSTRAPTTHSLLRWRLLLVVAAAGSAGVVAIGPPGVTASTPLSGCSQGTVSDRNVCYSAGRVDGGAYSVQNVGPELPCVATDDGRLRGLLTGACDTVESIKSGPTETQPDGGAPSCCYLTEVRENNDCIGGRPLLLGGSARVAPLARRDAWVAV